MSNYKYYWVPSALTVVIFVGFFVYPFFPIFPARGNIFSVHIWTGASDHYLQKAKELGVGWVRIGNGGNWGLIENPKGVYNWISS